MSFVSFVVVRLCVAGGVAFAQPVALKQVGTFRVPADTVELRGSHAFVAGGRTLTILDLSDPVFAEEGR